MLRQVVLASGRRILPQRQCSNPCSCQSNNVGQTRAWRTSTNTHPSNFWRRKMPKGSAEPAANAGCKLRTLAARRLTSGVLARWYPSGLCYFRAVPITRRVELCASRRLRLIRYASHADDMVHGTTLYTCIVLQWPILSGSRSRLVPQCGLGSFHSAV